MNTAAYPTIPVDDDETARRALMRGLIAELFQAERSAEAHCQREAKRHAADLPAAALWTISRQARASLTRLTDLADGRGFGATKAATLAGSLFSTVRELVTDRILSAERSWRATLLGVRHGLDVAISLRLVAETLGDDEVVAYCDGLLRERQPLADEVANTLWWFAEHPQRALAAARA